MKFTVTWKRARIAIEAFVILKYNVIQDALQAARHGLSFVCESVNSVSESVTRTAESVEYHLDGVHTSMADMAVNDADAALLKLIITTALLFFVAYRFQIIPRILKALRGETKATRGETKATRGKTKATSGGKEARFQKWVARYGKDYKTKKEAKAAFTAFEKDMGYN